MAEEKITDSTIVGMDEFDQNLVSPGEEVKLYRRIEDMYKPNAIAVLNKKGEPIGYLEESQAGEILEKMREGIKFKCVAASERDGNTMPLRIYELGKPVLETDITDELPEDLDDLLPDEEDEDIEDEEDIDDDIFDDDTDLKIKFSIDDEDDFDTIASMEDDE